MGAYYQGSKIAGAYYQGKKAAGAYYQGKKVFGQTAIPAGLSHTAHIALSAMYNTIVTATSITLDPADLSPKSFVLDSPEPQYPYNINLNIAGFKITKDPITNSYVLDLGKFSDFALLPLNPITKDNTPYRFTGVETIHLVINGAVICSFNMNGVSNLQTTTGDIPASPQYDADSGQLYQKAADIRANHLVYYSDPAVNPVGPALLESVFDSVALNPYASIEIYWT